MTETKKETLTIPTDQQHAAGETPFEFPVVNKGRDGTAGAVKEAMLSPEVLRVADQIAQYLYAGESVQLVLDDSSLVRPLVVRSRPYIKKIY